MKADLHTMIYAAALGLICATLLTVVGQQTAPLVRANRLAFEQRNVMEALGLEVPPQARPAELAELFEQRVRRTSFAGLEGYELFDAAENRVLGTALPVRGSGMWGPIEGYLALEGDGRTIRGLRFHSQEETPGLGGLIGDAGYVQGFVGRSIVDEQGRPGLRIVPRGTVSADNEIDGITGATVTTEKVEELLNRTIREIASP
jgi:Na+-transporting NADH:ubiquinone oxidoreductase subunit C